MKKVAKITVSKNMNLCKPQRNLCDKKKVSLSNDLWLKLSDTRLRVSQVCRTETHALCTMCSLLIRHASNKGLSAVNRNKKF